MITPPLPEPFLFNALKHHKGYIKEFVSASSIKDNETILKDLRHLGTSVMDVYTGVLSSLEICMEIDSFLKNKSVFREDEFHHWTGPEANEYKIIDLSDGSKWILKYHRVKNRYIHFFPARYGPMTMRIKANTLKSALLYLILIDKDSLNSEDSINSEDLNNARIQVNLSPIKDLIETEAITEMIGILGSLD